VSFRGLDSWKTLEQLEKAVTKVWESNKAPLRVCIVLNSGAEVGAPMSITFKHFGICGGKRMQGILKSGLARLTVSFTVNLHWKTLFCRFIVHLSSWKGSAIVNSGN